MHVLLTNDDGLRAPGIAALYDALMGHIGGFPGPLGEAILPVAPLTVQTATSHGVTFAEPLMVETVQVNERMTGIAVDGRPADCVKLTLSTLWPERFGSGHLPDLILSGMNMGANCGINVIYSGTVAAAIEGAFLGIPSIAVSLHLGPGKARYDVAACHARRAIERILRHPLAAHTCLNVNVPMTERDTPMPDVRVVPMNTHGLIDRYEERVSPLGKKYFWAAAGAFDFHATESGSDVDRLLASCITVTPLQYDLTQHRTVSEWRGRLEPEA